VVFDRFIQTVRREFFEPHCINTTVLLSLALDSVPETSIRTSVESLSLRVSPSYHSTEAVFHATMLMAVDAYALVAFSALTLLVGQQEGHSVCKVSE